MTQDQSNKTTIGHDDEAIRSRWLATLQAHQPNLPQPVAIAMVEAVGRGSLGQALQKIEHAFIELGKANLDDLTGSEARVLVAILRQMDDELAQLETRLNYLWEKK